MIEFENYGDLGIIGVEMPAITVDPKYGATGSNLEFLKTRCEQGLKDLGLWSKNYIDRLEYEIGMFDELKYVDYMLAVWDICNFASENSISMGPGRGSAAGSLALYSLRVTDIDPLKHDLYFERFVSKARAKFTEKDGVVYFDGSLLCDVDLDFDYNRREEVIDYINNRYVGQTAHILTVSTLSGKLVFREVMKIASGFFEEEVNEISDSIPKEFGIVKSLDVARGESEKFDTFCKANPKIYRISRKLEDLNKNFGIHASGIAITAKPIRSIMPVQRTKEGKLITGADMKWVSEICVKFDILGLKTASIIENVCQMVGIKRNEIDVNHPSIYAALQILDDPKGLFQIEGDAQYSACKQIKPANIDELSDLLGICRPGASSYIGGYVDVKKDSSLRKQIHPEMDKILSKTKGIILFQETLMEVGKKVFGLSLDDAEQIRRACGKKIKKDMEKWYPIIHEKAQELGVEQKVADFYIKCLEESASYSFNKCVHPDSVIETMTGYKTIKEVSIGEIIRAYDTKLDRLGYVQVTEKCEQQVEMFEFEMTNGRRMKCSMDHKFLTPEGMVSIGEILKRDLDIIEDGTFEEFRDVKGYEGVYKISNKGTIVRIPQTYSNSKITYKGGERKPFFDKDGYPRIELNNQTRRKFHVHRLVAQSFLDNPDNLATVNHKNGIKTDNSVENLEWMSIADNNRHAFRTGLNKSSRNNLPPVKRGELHSRAKLKEIDVSCIRGLRKQGLKLTEIATRFGIDMSTVSDICSYKTWKHLK